MVREHNEIDFPIMVLTECAASQFNKLIKLFIAKFYYILEFGMVSRFYCVIEKYD